MKAYIFPESRVEKMMQKAIFVITMVLGLVLSGYSGVSALPTEIENGVGYLTANQNADGSWGDDTTSTEIVFAIAEIIETISRLDLGSSQSYIAATQWLNDLSIETTAELARRLWVNGQGAQDFDLLLSYVDIYSAAWGGHDFYGNNHLDTALAVMALKRVNNDIPYTTHVIERSVEYLKDHQNQDGGWGFTSDDDSNVYVSATVLRAIIQNRNTSLQACIRDGVQYLLSHHNGDGGFGFGGNSTIYESAYSYFALQESGEDVIATALSLRSYLISHQIKQQQTLES